MPCHTYLTGVQPLEVVVVWGGGGIFTPAAEHTELDCRTRENKMKKSGKQCVPSVVNG